MKTTIITGVAAIALAAPAFAGAPVTYTAPTPAPSNLGLSGNISLSYQNQYSFRGITTVAADAVKALGNYDTDNVVMTDINADYAFTESFSLVAGARINTLSDTSIDHNTYRAGLVWLPCESFSVGFGYQYQDFRTIAGTANSDELYLNIGYLCPWTGANFNLLWAHALGSLDGSGFLGGVGGATNVLNGDYLELNANKSFELNAWASVEITLGVSYAIDYWSNGSDFNHWYATLDFPMKATEYLTVSPYVTYTDGLGATDNVFGSGLNEGDQVLWGIKASVNF